MRWRRAARAEGPVRVTDVLVALHTPDRDLRRTCRLVVPRFAGVGTSAELVSAGAGRA